MSETELPLEHWFADVVKDLSGTKIAELRGVVHRVARSCAPSETRFLVGYAHGLAGTAERGHAVIDEVSDDVPVGGPGDARSARLAAAAVAHLLTAFDSSSAVCAAFETRTAALLGLSPQLPELPTLAENALGRIAHQRRCRPGTPPSVREVVANELGRGPGVPDDQGPANHAEVRAGLVLLRKAARAAADATDACNREFRRHQGLIDEEVDVLWWALSDRSRTQDSDWTSIGASAPLIAAVELFGSLTIDPPPPSVRTLLRRPISQARLDPDATFHFGRTEAALPPVPKVAESDWFSPVLSWMTGDGTETHPERLLEMGSAIDIAEQLVRELSRRRVLEDQ